jgi:peptide/nickel transport system substrate-binding protein
MRFILPLIAASLLLSSCDFRVERDWRGLVHHIPSEPPTLNPITHMDGIAYRVDSFIFDTMLDMDFKTLEIIPKVAKRWEISADRLVYTFHLRDDVYWHDGAKLTADDVIYSFERVMDPKVDAAAKRSYFRDVTKMEKIDDFTVSFTYAFPYFRAIEILGGMPIMPKHILDDGTDFNKHPFGRNPVGSGPYRFKRWETGKYVLLERNENYWGVKPEITELDFRIVTDLGVALQVMKKGDIDFAVMTPIQWARQTGSRNFEERFNKYKYYIPNYSFIGWNEKRPFFGDKRVRRAMSMLINREKIAEKFYFGLAEVVTGDAYKFGPDYDNSIAPYPYDPAAAARLLDEAGWTDHDGDGIRDKNGIPFKFTFAFSGVRAEAMANFLREELKKVGVAMEPERFEWTVFNKKINDRSFDAAILAWGGPFEDDHYQLWHSSQIEKGSNFVGFRNDEVDRLLEEARREFDPEMRHVMYRRFHRIIHDEEPYTFLFTIPTLTAVEKRFTNVNVYKGGIDMFEWRITRPEAALYE